MGLDSEILHVVGAFLRSLWVYLYVHTNLLSVNVLLHLLGLKGRHTRRWKTSVNRCTSCLESNVKFRSDQRLRLEEDVIVHRISLTLASPQRFWKAWESSLQWMHLDVCSSSIRSSAFLASSLRPLDQPLHQLRLEWKWLTLKVDGCHARFRCPNPHERTLFSNPLYTVFFHVFFLSSLLVDSQTLLVSVSFTFSNPMAGLDAWRLGPLAAKSHHWKGCLWRLIHM